LASGRCMIATRISFEQLFVMHIMARESPVSAKRCTSVDK
jgi:hypothetical protein